jgi:hypothetical protein
MAIIAPCWPRVCRYPAANDTPPSPPGREGSPETARCLPDAANGVRRTWCGPVGLPETSRDRSAPALCLAPNRRPRGSASPLAEAARARPGEAARLRGHRRYHKHVRFVARADKARRRQPQRRRVRCCFRSFERQGSQQDLGAKLGANSHSLQATPGHCQRQLMQLIGRLSDTRRRPAMLRRCLLNRGSMSAAVVLGLFLLSGVVLGSTDGAAPDAR